MNKMGWQDRSDSMAAGKRLATAVPEVLITADALPLAVDKPNAKNAAERSSTAVIRDNSENSANPPAAKAKGPDLLPGHKTTYFKPLETNASKSLIQINKFFFAKDRDLNESN